ncbi:c-type cytochrome [Lysobacter sp. LF1]|uniref:C-type cytochrome n=1 Tax=Lysobacter stagni TaxID=3045172 RepID=A0ABT6XG86_9GAMM|nr:c-type cytochrome [Lysobacter sp. LF1]MDI9239157.1 c-type cytochrome [Lysobacter sp. LF1]
MRRLAKWIGLGLVVVLVAVAGLFVAGYVASERAMAKTWIVQDPPLREAIATASLEHGRHLYATRGCADCHGADGAGRLLVDAPNVVRVVPANLTRAVRDPAYDDDALAAAIRHGVRPDGTALVIMPTGDYAGFDDHDVASIIAYLRTLPAVESDPGRTQVRPLGRVLYLLGKLPLFPAENVDHTPRPRRSPPAVANAAYGRYVAQVCTGCHGSDFAGGYVLEPGTPPSANLTPHAMGLAQWTETDFLHLMRTGQRPDGRHLHRMMPWKAYSQMQDVELRAIWAYLDTLPPLPNPKR